MTRRHFYIRNIGRKLICTSLLLAMFGGTLLFNLRFVNAQSRRAWAWQNPLPQGNALKAVRFAEDKLHGWAVGTNSVVLRTEDGGFDWTIQQLPVETSLNALFVADAESATVVGASGTVLQTTDGGKTWTLRRSNTKDHLLGVHFVSDIVASNRAASAQTTPSKKDAQPNQSTTARQQRTGRVQTLFGGKNRDEILRRSHGWAVGTYGTIVITKDGGRTWTAQASGVREHLYAVAFSNKQSGVAVGANGTLLVTQDGGATWRAEQPQTGKLEQSLTGVAFASGGRRAVAVGYGGAILKTEDRARTWTTVDAFVRTDLTAIHFAGELTAWAVSGDGTVLSTADSTLR